MSNLINNSEELKENFAGLSLNFTWANIRSYAEDVERDIIAQTIGPDALGYFQNNLSGLTGVKQQALILLQRSVSYLTIFRWSHFALFQFEDKALFLAKTTTGAIPSDKKLSDLRGRCEEDGSNFLDKALELMENNLDQFPDYRDSGTRQTLNQGFIKTAIEFSRQRSIGNSRLTFLSMFGIMIDVQDDCLPAVMTSSYYELFKERYLDDDLSAGEQKLLPLIRKAVAMHTVAKACNQLPVKITAQGLFINKYINSIDYEMKDAAGIAERDYLKVDHEDKATRELGKLKAYMIANATDLPGYVIPASDDVQLNCQNNGFFSF